MTEQVKIKSTYLGGSKLKDAIAAAGPKGLRVVMFKPKEPKFGEDFNGHIEVKQPTDTEGAVIFGCLFFKTSATDKSPLVDKNGQQYMRLEVGNRGDMLIGAVFSNTKRPGIKDADLRFVVNYDREHSVDGKLWISEPKAGGDKYYSGALGSKPEAEAAPAEAAAPATTEAATAPDPFGL